MLFVFPTEPFAVIVTSHPSVDRGIGSPYSSNNEIDGSGLNSRMGVVSIGAVVTSEKVTGVFTYLHPPNHLAEIHSVAPRWLPGPAGELNDHHRPRGLIAL